jgi:hypothetical protein
MHCCLGHSRLPFTGLCHDTSRQFTMSNFEGIYIRLPLPSQNLLYTIDSNANTSIKHSSNLSTNSTTANAKHHTRIYIYTVHLRHGSLTGTFDYAQQPTSEGKQMSRYADLSSLEKGQEWRDSGHKDWFKNYHRVGRVAIVNSKGEAILDVFAAYPKQDGVYKFVPPRRFGVTKEDLKYENGAVPAYKVERWVKQLLNGRKVILHGGKHNRTAFTIEKGVFANSDVIDTQVIFSDLQDDGTPSLKTTARAELGEDIQEDGVHTPIEDAQMAMKLYQHSERQKQGATVNAAAPVGIQRDHANQTGVADRLQRQATTARVYREPILAPVLYTIGGAILDV